MTEASLLRLAISWIDTNRATSNKEYLMQKIDVTSLHLDEYLGIIEEFPTFFTNVEMSYAIKQIRSRGAVQTVPKKPEAKTQIKEYRNAGTNTDKVAETATKVKVEKDFNKEELLADVAFVSNLVHFKILLNIIYNSPLKKAFGVIFNSLSVFF